jgi:hypothetical protein
MLIPYLQRLATLKIPINRKNSKANSIFISRNIDLAAKTPQKWPVFSVSTKTWCADLSPRHCGIGNYVDSWKPSFLSQNPSAGRDGSARRPYLSGGGRICVKKSGSGKLSHGVAEVEEKSKIVDSHGKNFKYRMPAVPHF